MCCQLSSNRRHIAAARGIRILFSFFRRGSADAIGPAACVDVCCLVLCPWAQHLPCVQVGTRHRMLPVAWPLPVLQVDLYTQQALLHCHAPVTAEEGHAGLHGVPPRSQPLRPLQVDTCSHKVPLLWPQRALQANMCSRVPPCSGAPASPAGGHLLPLVAPEGFLDPVLQRGPCRAAGRAEPCGAPPQCWARGGCRDAWRKQQCCCAELPDCHRASFSSWHPVALELWVGVPPAPADL